MREVFIVLSIIITIVLFIIVEIFTISASIKILRSKDYHLLLKLCVIIIVTSIVGIPIGIIVTSIVE